MTSVISSTGNVDAAISGFLCMMVHSSASLSWVCKSGPSSCTGGLHNILSLMLVTEATASVPNIPMVERGVFNQADKHTHCSWRSKCNCQTDESLFRQKPKYHRGRAPWTEQWVLGLDDTSKQPAVGYVEIIPCRDTQTLLPIIRAHTSPGTTIHSDEWRAYSTVGQLPNVSNHSTVNHSLHFVDPSTGVHTQHMLKVTGAQSSEDSSLWKVSAPTSCLAI